MRNPRPSLKTLLTLVLLVGLGMVVLHPLMMGSPRHHSADCPVCYLLSQGFILVEILFIPFMVRVIGIARSECAFAIGRVPPTPRGRAPPSVCSLSIH